MPRYQYEGKKESGGQVEGVIEAPSRSVATVRLRQMGVWIQSLDEEGDPARRSGPPAPGVGARGKARWSLLYGLCPVSAGALSNFFEQVCGLYRAGVGMQTVVDDTAGRVDSGRLRMLLLEVSPRIAQGESLGDCLADYPQVFSRGVVGMIRAGELSGNLDEMARDLADEFRAEQRVWWLLLIPKIYFTIVITLAALIPSFPGIIRAANIGEGLHWWRGHVVANILPWMLLVVGLYLLYRVVWHLPALRGLKDRLAYGLPIWSALTRRVGLARFYRALEITVRAGVDFPTAMDAAAEAAGNAIMIRQLRAAAARMRSGTSLHDALEPCAFIGPSVKGQLGSADLGGTFDETLPRMAEQTRASRNTLIAGLRVGAVALGYVITSGIVIVSAVRGYMEIYRAQADRAGIEDLF